LRAPSPTYPSRVPSTSTNLDDLYGEIEAEIEEFARFPSLPEADAGAPLALWPDDDWRAFVDVARRVPVSLLYVEAQTLSDDDLDEILNQLSDEDRLSVLGASERVSDLAVIRMCFAVGGVLHVLELEAAWLADLNAAMDRDRVVVGEMRRLDRDEEMHLVESIGSRTKDWQVEVGEARAFYAAPNDDARLRAASLLVPELAPYLEKRESTASGLVKWAAEGVVRKAYEYSRDVVKPRLRHEVLDDASVVAIRVRANPKFKNASTKARRERIVRAELIDQIGFSDPELVDAVEDALASDGL
jgi:hypothetical protein